MTSPLPHPAPPHYPYGPDPLLPAWGSVKAQALAVLALLGAASGGWLGHAAGWPVNEVALLAVLPGALAVTLAFAPEPATRLGTMAKDLLCLATAAAPLCGPAIHLLIAAVPALLAGAVALDRGLPPGLRVPARYRRMPGARR
ncbi:hypothetical protein [Methylobacterium nonmethylotrophicum]|uniref:Uncharacterized protein n=1 Tax=Methylobacterium nonmethylotrophicum TaxID=1141884 RepID=A0A4Z0NRG7_9HYPH|nr:hypothetical protein [Methylobacterium nonmethylotrophicum]TGD99030.1 hypothetical protein EU555_14085 [Methylobacterium nonmethylotrophicum]